MDRSRSSAFCACILVAVATPACQAPSLESPRAAGERSELFLVRQDQKDQVNVLFVVDNSASMEPMAAELRQRFPELLRVFSELAAAGKPLDLHLGVITTDYGAGTGGAPGCAPSPGGQRGVLQPVGAMAPAGCRPPVGARYLRYHFAGGNNLPPGQDLEASFACMASVGTAGCGFEHVLESAYAALHDNAPANADFLRDDALLAVVFLTNEDDSSAPPDTDLFDKSRAAAYGFESSYRSTRFGVVCGPDGAPPPYGASGPLSGCRPAPNPGGVGPGKLFDVGRYQDFFTRPAAQGGVKVDPQDVLLVSIAAPPEPFEVVLARSGSSSGDPVRCAALDEGASPPCVPVLLASCRNPARPSVFGDPAVRLDAVVRSAAHHAESSICADDYSAALADLGRLIAVGLGGGCVTGRLPRDPAGAPIADCAVDEVTALAGGGEIVSTLPRCEAAGPRPCWRLEEKSACACDGGTCAGRSPDGVGITVEREGEPPPRTWARVSCATL